MPETAPIQTLRDLFLRAPDPSGPPFLFQHGETGELRAGGDWRRETREIGAGLRALGCNKGDRVLLMAENRPEWPAVYFAAVASGLAIVPVSIFWEEAELTALLPACQPSVTIVAPRFAARAAAAGARLPHPPRLIILPSLPAESDAPPLPQGALPYPELLRLGRLLLAGAPDPLDAARVEAGDLAEILFVSSSLAVQLSHGALMANLYGVVGALWPEPPREPRRLMIIFPYSHLYPTLFGILIPVFFGWTAVASASARPDYIIRLLRETAPHYLVLVPLLLERLHRRLAGRWKKNNGRPEALGLGALEFIFTAGVKCPEGLFAAMEAMGVPVLEGYGVSEMAPFITVNAPGAQRPGSAGKVLPNVELAIDGPDAWGVGEIMARGPNLMMGYRNRRPAIPDGPAAFREGALWRDEAGWLHTGDLGSVDAEGFLHVRGRLRPILVTRGGSNIYPSEVEGLLSGAPFIRRIRVAPGYDEGEGEYPLALVEPEGPDPRTMPPEEREERRLAVEEGLAGLAGRAAAYKIPKRVELVGAGELDALDRADPRRLFTHSQRPPRRD